MQLTFSRPLAHRFRLPLFATAATVSPMRRRAFCIALLIFQAIWLNVIVPGHTRGVVALPGCACESGCPPLACCGSNHPDSSHHAPVRDPASGCAICYFAARLTLPPVVDFTPPRLGLAEILDPPVARSATSVGMLLALRDRAPPLFG